MCKLCERIKNIKAGKDTALIKEFEYSYLVLGEHQFFKGYAMVILKDHISDLTDIDPKLQMEYLSEVMMSAKAIKDSFNPYKINYAVLGNEVEHVHFHIFPRYEKELKKEKVKHPWANAEQFKDFMIDDLTLFNRVADIQKNL